MDAEKMASTVQKTFTEIYSNLGKQLEKSEDIINQFEVL